VERDVVELRGMTWDHTRGYAPLAVTAQIYADWHPDVQLSWDRRSLFDFGEGGVDALVDAYDIFVIDHPLIGLAVEQGALAPLDDLPAAPAVGRSATSYQRHGHTYALPVDAACQVAAARIDLLDRHGEARPDDWPTVLDLARRTGLVGVPLTQIDVWSCLLSLCGALDETPFAGDAIAPHDTLVEAFEMVRSLAGAVDAAYLGVNPIAVLNRMASSDDIAYCPLTFGYVNYSRPGYCRSVLEFSGPPPVQRGGSIAPCLGGVGLAVSARSAHRDEAAAYVAWTCGASVQRGEYALAGGQPAAVAAWEDERANALSSDYFRRTRAAVEAAVPRPSDAWFGAFQSGAAAALHDALRRGLSATDAVIRLERAWRDARAR
jgi:multiple sugar transport system substrate-binding protein